MGLLHWLRVAAKRANWHQLVPLNAPTATAILFNMAVAVGAGGMRQTRRKSPIGDFLPSATLSDKKSFY